MNQTVPVILLDDDPDEHFLFRTDLEDAGYQLDIESFSRPEEAITFLSERDGGPVLVLTDMGMAGADPVEFIRDAAKLLHGGAIGAFSGAQSPDTDARCREAGASFYIVKPISDAKLEAAIATSERITIEVTPAGKRRLACT